MNKPIDMKDLMKKLESINETTSEQYEVMLDKAGELGEIIANNAIVDVHPNRDAEYAEYAGHITGKVNNHIEAASKRMSTVARRYVRRHLSEEIISEANNDPDKMWNADVHIKELVRIIISKAESVARSRDLDRDTEAGRSMWEGIISYQIDSVQTQLADALKDARIEHEYLMNQDARTKTMKDIF